MAICNMCGAIFGESPGVARSRQARAIRWSSLLALVFTLAIVARLLEFSNAAVGYSAWGILPAVVLALVVIWLLMKALKPILADGLTSQYCPSCADAMVECKRRPGERSAQNQNPKEVVKGVWRGTINPSFSLPFLRCRISPLIEFRKRMPGSPWVCGPTAARPSL